MSSEGDLRQPYGPGWEDPDWTPHAPPATEPEPAGVCAVDPRATLSQYMENLRRVAVALPAANAKRLERKGRPGLHVHAGQTRRWVVATGASLLAVGSFALPRSARPPEAATRPGTASNASGAAPSPAEADAPRRKR